MLGMLNGGERTQAEYQPLLEKAGFTFEEVTATPTPISVSRRWPDENVPPGAGRRYPGAR